MVRLPGRASRGMTMDEGAKQGTLDIPQVRWIPVAERLPEESGDYLAYTYADTILTLPYSRIYGVFNAFDDCEPEEAEALSIICTHWMPLPEPPREDTK